MREKDLYPIVANFFQKKGYLVLCDYVVHPSLIRPDIIALSPSREDERYYVYDKHSEITSVEVKKSRRGIVKALIQALEYATFSEYVYIALPYNCLVRDLETRLKKLGFGLLSIAGSVVTKRIEAQKNKVNQEVKAVVMKRLHLKGGCVILRKGTRITEEILA